MQYNVLKTLISSSKNDEGMVNIETLESFVHQVTLRLKFMKC
jgi:hypothetical protein